MDRPWAKSGRSLPRGRARRVGALVAADRAGEGGACERAAPARRRRGDHRREGGALQRAAEPVTEARRDKVNRHPQEGWVEQDRDEVLDGRHRGDRRAARGPAGRGGRLRARPPGRVGARLGRRQRQAAHRRSSSGRTSARRRSSTASADREEEVQKLSGLPLRPVLLRREARLAARERRRVEEGPGGRQPADGDGRLVPLRPARRRLRHRRRDRVATQLQSGSTGVRRPALRDLRCPRRRPARDPRHRRRSRDPQARELAGRAAAAWSGASTSRPRSRAPPASSPGGSRRPTAPASSS